MLQLRDRLLNVQVELLAALSAEKTAHLKVELEVHQSIANTHPHLRYEITSVRELTPPAALAAGYKRFIANLPTDCTPTERLRRKVFHTCPAATLSLIETSGMRPSHCAMCRGLTAFAPHDNGWFGDHTKGVYVSKHMDYTFFYQHYRDPQPGDEGTVLMLEIVTGKVDHFTQRRDGAPPTPGYHCHETPNHLEYFVFDDESTSEPPRPTHRVLPLYAVSWRALRNDRMGIVHDGN